METAVRCHAPAWWISRPAVVLGMLILLGACAAENRKPAVAPQEDRDEIALGGPREHAGDGASLTGTLAPEPGCVYLATPEGTVLPVFPHDVVRWDGTMLRLDGREYRAGDPITVGGGYRDPDSFNLDEIAPHLPGGCRTDTVFAVT